MNELAIGRRKDAAIFRQQGTVKAEKKAAAIAAGKGLRLVEQELDALGVGLEEVQAYQEHCEDGGDEVSRALDALARKRFTAKNRWQAGYRFLVQRGYSNDAASSAVRLWIESE